MESNGNRMVTWQRWETKSYMHDGKLKTKKVQTIQRGTFAALFKELLAETETLAKHLFVANWQQDQFTHITRKLPADWSLVVLDFAENYACIAQNEIQSAHWAIQQVTVHQLWLTIIVTMKSTLMLCRKPWHFSQMIWAMMLMLSIILKDWQLAT